MAVSRTYIGHQFWHEHCQCRGHNGLSYGADTTFHRTYFLLL